MAKKPKKYRFEDRSRYGRGIISTVASAVSVILFLSTAFICMVMAGKAPQWIGALGFSGFVMGFYGMVAGLEEISGGVMHRQPDIRLLQKDWRRKIRFIWEVSG